MRSVVVNAGQVSRRLRGLSAAAIQPVVKRHGGRAGMQLMNDAVLKGPSCPLDESPLQSSGSVFVNNRMAGTSKEFQTGGVKTPGHVPTPLLMYSPKRRELQTIITVIFNKSYATRVHEGTTLHFQQKKGNEGAKFLSSKIFGYYMEYLQIVANGLRERVATT